MDLDVDGKMILNFFRGGGRYKLRRSVIELNDSDEVFDFITARNLLKGQVPADSSVPMHSQVTRLLISGCVV
jgi:hypothetical protein